MRSLLIYYGWPSLVNGACGLVDAAAAEFNVHHYLILGDGLEFPKHPDYWKTVRILQRRPAGSVTFGYIDLGVSTQNLDSGELDWRVAMWQVAGVDGVFWDDAGSDFGVTRERLDRALDACRVRDLISCVNCWNPADLSGSRIGGEDFVLAEAWQPPFAKRGRQLRRLRDAAGVQVLGCTEGPYDRRLHRRCVRAARRYGFLGYGWQEPGYHVDSRAPLRVP